MIKFDPRNLSKVKARLWIEPMSNKVSFVSPSGLRLSVNNYRYIFDDCEASNGKLSLKGWIFHKDTGVSPSGIIAAKNDRIINSIVQFTSRPDVRDHFDLLTDDFGFEYTVPIRQGEVLKLFAYGPDDSFEQLTSKNIAVSDG